MEDSSLVPDPIRTSVGSVAIARQVQTASSFAYSATYNAQFQVLRDRLCSSEAPVVRVSCRGPNIQVLSTSDATIVCSSEMEADPEGRYFIECENTCASDNDCQEIYLQIDGDSWDGPFGEISFQCQGEELYEVDGYASIPGDEEGGSGGNCPSLSRLFHFVRLGVLCPAMDGSGGGGGDSQFVYDDLFFECFILNFPVDGYAENVYTCAVGERCDKAFCQIAFDDLVVHATLPRFQDQCVTPPVPVTLAPTPTMIDSLLLDAVSITARFQAAWGILLDDDETCSSNTPTVRITCLNGSSIRFISSIYDSASCQPAGDNALDCTDSTTDNIENEFTGVVYVRVLLVSHYPLEYFLLYTLVLVPYLTN